MKKIVLATIAATVMMAGATTAQADDYSMRATTYNDMSPYAGSESVYVDADNMVVYRSYSELHPVYYRDYSGGNYDWTYWRQTTPSPDTRRDQRRNYKQH